MFEFFGADNSTFLREKLLEAKEKFSFETVFSHESKVEFMEKAKAQGYKVYLYFVSTKNADINVYRVKKIRVPRGGHDVPEDRIRKRYKRSLNLLFRASQSCYTCYYFDNSVDNQKHQMFVNFKINNNGEKNWKGYAYQNLELVPNWFKIHYLKKLIKKN